MSPSLPGFCCHSGCGFQHHVVLVELRVEGADLALPVGVVERVVDRGGRNAQPRCGHAVDRKLNRVGAGLLIRGHVFQLRQLLQLRHKFVGPLVQLVRVGIFERVLVLRAAYAIVDRDVLHRLHVEVHALHLRQIGLQPPNHVGGADVLGTR